MISAITAAVTSLVVALPPRSAVVMPEAQTGFLLTEPGKHLCRGPEGSDRVGDALAHNVEGRTVDRLEHGRALTGWI